MNITEIIRDYTAGAKTLEQANAALAEAGSRLRLDPDKNTLTEAERKTHGLLDTGTGSLDKVEIRDGHLADCACGAMYALVLYDGGVYRVHGTELLSY